jgi:hypothetical protein
MQNVKSALENFGRRDALSFEKNDYFPAQPSAHQTHPYGLVCTVWSAESFIRIRYERARGVSLLGADDDYLRFCQIAA